MLPRFDFLDALPPFLPVQLTAVARRLQSYSHTSTVLRLMASHFPEILKEDYKTLTMPSWEEVLGHLLILIEENDWFEIDWDDYNYGLECLEENDPETVHYLSTLLHYIPIKLYGFNSAFIRLYPPIDLLRVLLSGSDEAAVGSEVLYLAIYHLSEWRPAHQEAAWNRVHTVEANPDEYPDWLRSLPGLARWACHRTGNAILDLPPPGWGHDGRRTLNPHRLSHHFTWREVDQLRMFWQAAKPLVKSLEAWMGEWNRTGESYLINLIHFLEGADHDHSYGP